jgi:uncharacterized protein YgbK (DUF1537 family)
MAVLVEHLLANLPPVWPADLLPAIQRRVRAMRTKVVVLDDDPTGTQTVHDVDVLTGWSVPELVRALDDDAPVVYLLTNSRSLTTPAAVRLAREIGAHLQAASQATGRPFAVTSRSDSTLRGHYPAETDALAEALGPFDGLLLCPFFLEGGRLTAGDMHYVVEGDRAVPAAETEFARDAVFGYRQSNLRAWVEEKTRGAIAAQAVRSISLDLLRLGGPHAVAEALMALRDGTPCVVNAVAYRDLEVLVLALLQAEEAGKRLIYRTAASFVRVRGGIAPAPLLQPSDLWRSGEAGGLVVVGSHVARTSAQLQATRALPGVEAIEAHVPRLLDAGACPAEIDRLACAVDAALGAGRDAVLYTSRGLVVGDDAAGSLGIGERVSAALVQVVRQLPRRPAWLIAKGGITSSDIATRALHIARARVLGQAIAGVPIWRAGAESRWPGLVYVVFPGNVGGPGTLADMIAILRQSPCQPQPEVSI